MNNSIKVAENKLLGRYVITERNVLAAEILFEEYPFVVGPKNNSKVICLVCCCSIDGSCDGPRCPKCKWPLCNKCINKSIHELECKLFVKNAVVFYNLKGSQNEFCLQLDCITPLRFLLAIELNPDKWNTDISFMEHHEKARRQSIQWNVDNNNIVGYLHGPCKLKNRFTAEIIQRVCGILEVNAFEGRTICGNDIRCLFPKTAIMSHSCVPNTCHSILPSDDYKIVVRAAFNIEKDKLLTACYTYTMSGTLTRQEHLKKGKYFTCTCERCVDPTELGTHFSSIKCTKCDSGFIVPSNPLDANTPWKCMKCNYTTTSSDVCQTLSTIQNEVNTVESIQFSPGAIEKCEFLLKKFKHTLHPNHFLFYDLRQNLIKLLGRTPGYLLTELSDIQLKHKIDMCQQILTILNNLHPGQTRTKAMILYEMHGPIVLYGKIALYKGLINETEMNDTFQKSIDMLDECITILQREDVASIEHKVVNISVNTLKHLQQERTKEYAAKK